jgi:hypothetical protein
MAIEVHDHASKGKMKTNEPLRRKYTSNWPACGCGGKGGIVTIGNAMILSNV